MGLSLGDQVVLVGMSTGAALATWLASLEFVRHNQHVASMVLISPAYALGHPLYPVLKYVCATMRMWAPQRYREWILHLLIGKVKSAPSLSAQHHRYTSLTYPSAALLHLLDVLFELESSASIKSWSLIRTPVQMLANPQDHVVDIQVTAANAFLQFGDPSRKCLYTMTGTEHKH